MCKRKTEVAIITASKFPGTTGDAANFSEIINQLIADGFKVLLICPKVPDSEDKELTSRSTTLKITRIPCTPPRLGQIKNGISYKLYLKLLLFLLVESFTVLRVLKGKKITHVYMRHSILTLSLPLLLKIAGLKVIADGELISDMLRGRINSKILGWFVPFEKKIIKLYSCYKVSTEAQAKSLQNQFALPREKILLLPISVNINKIPRFTIREIPEHTFGYFGGLEPWQGVDILIEAFQTLLKRIPTAILYIIGEGSLKNKFQELVRNKELSSNILIFNSVEREVLWHNYFKRFRIVVIPRPRHNNSLDSILPIKLVESLAAGKVVIAMNIPVMREIERNAILLIPCSDPTLLADAMEKLSTDNEKLNQYSEAAVQTASNYNIQENIKKLARALMEL